MTTDQSTQRLTYFPGCMLQGLAREYDRTLRAVCKALDIELEPLQDWNCCGGPAGLVNQTDARTFARRNFKKVPVVEGKRRLAVACAWCYFNLKQQALATSPSTEADASPVEIVHLLEVLSQGPVLAKLKEIYTKRVETEAENELLAVPCAVYYGCLLTRPHATGMDLADNDGPMEQLLRAVKLPVKSWTKRQTCCGAYHGFSNVEIADRLCGEILEDAQKAGARAIVTACPLCQYNLDVRQYEIGKKLRRPIYMPIYHFSEVLAYVLAPESAEAALSRHMNSDRQLVAELLKPGS